MMKLEKMDDFFAARIDGYDEHMKRDIEGASDFYAYTASLLPLAGGSRVLDLGCGTGLELEEYFVLNPGAAVTGIDLSEAMLNVLKAKFPDCAEPRRGRHGDRSVRSHAECAESQIPGQRLDADPCLLF